MQLSNIPATLSNREVAMHTLNSIQNLSGINRGQLAKVAEDLGIATGRGITISDEDRDRLVDEAKRRSEARLQALIQANTIKDSEAPTEPAGQLQVIQPGENHLAPPEAPTSFDLSTFGLNTLDTFEDPLAVAQRAIAAMDALQQGMNSHIESLETRRKQTAQAVTSIKSKQDELKLTTLRAQILEQVTTQQITEGQQQLTEALGKSAAA